VKLIEIDIEMFVIDWIW